MSKEDKKDVNKEVSENSKTPTQQEQLEGILSKLEGNDFNMYFFVLDTKGNPAAGVANIYEHVKVLNELGYNAHILHEKSDYKLRNNPNDPNDDGRMGIAEMYGEEYADLPHVSIDSQVDIKTEDFIFIPEVFSSIMHDVQKFTCKKVVICQNYHYLLELLNPGTRWQDYGFFDVITTSEVQAKYIKEIFMGIRTHIVPVSIPKYFEPTEEMKKPVISILTRDNTDALRLTKEFYLRFPMYKWVSFRELRNLPRKKFAEALKDSCLAVWVDPVSGFGTFPIEAMECDTPVIGKIPNMIPEWMLETVESQEEGEEPTVKLKDNGVWTDNTMNIPSLIAEFMKVWLEDNVPQVIHENMEDTKSTYTEEAQREKIEEVYANLLEGRKKEISSLMKPIKKEDK